MIDKRRPAIGLVLAAGLMGATAAQAAEATETEAIEVIGKRKPFRGDVPLQQTPQSAKVLSDELIATTAATQLDNLLDLASGVARQNTFGGLWDSFAIRGFAGDENTPSGYLVNGFNAGRGFSGRRDVAGLESVEVLKGPGSALYGRGEPGGTINLVTKKPRFKPEGSLELSAGSFNTQRLAGDYTGPLGQNVAFRINGAYEDADSFRDHFHARRLSLTPSLLFKLGAATTLSYEFEYTRQSAPFDRGVVATAEGALGVVPVSRFLGEPGDGNTQVEARGHQLVLNHDLGPGWSVLVGLGWRTSSFKGFSSDPELVAGRQTYYASAASTRNTLLSRQRRYRDYAAEDLTARAELTGRLSTGRLVHHLLAGVDSYDYELDQVQTRVRPTLADPYAVNVFNPVYGQTRTPTPFVNTLEHQRATGVYLQDQIDLDKQWKLMAGVRVDRFRQSLDNRIARSTQGQAQSATSPRLGVVYQATEALSAYGSCSKGFRPNSGQAANGVAFEPEFSQSCELGGKWLSADRRLSGTLAVYRAKKSNILTADPVNAGFSLSVGEAQSQGLELDVGGRLANHWLLNLAYAYTDAKLTKAVLDPNFSLALPAGSGLINIPKHSGNLLLVREFELPGGGQWSLGGSITHVGDRLGETGVPSFRLPAYTLAGLVGSYAPTPQLKLSLNVHNLFDKTYYASSYARLWVAPGTPRAVTLRLQYQWL